MQFPLHAVDRPRVIAVTDVLSPWASIAAGHQQQEFELVRTILVLALADGVEGIVVGADVGAHGMD